MKKYPKILTSRALDGKRLEIVFEGNIKKIYDCTPLLSEEIFKPLQDNALFNNVQTGAGGYGVEWNEQLDLCESELWGNGISE